MDYHPQNTASKYTTKLNQVIELEGGWEVGLVEVSFPPHVENVLEGHCYYTMTFTSGRQLKIEMPAGLYNEGSAVLRALHSAQRSAMKMRPGDPLLVTFRYPSNHQYFTVKINNRVLPNMAIAHVKFSYRLAALMGFDSEQTYGGTDTHRSRKKHDLVAGLSVVYVYCDLLEPILIGDTKAPLLRICSRPIQKTNKYRESYRAFNPIQYVPLQKKCFDTVTLQVMTDDGLVVPFLDGKTVIVLEFRRTTHPYYLI